MNENPIHDPKQEIIEKLKSATNILVTVSSNPSVDQLAACIGLTLLLNKLKKHATAVFSGTVPSTIEFLKPDETLEKNTDSLRDFIIALDKSKADKLRYKVEENVVKIFITPYKTSISQDDLDFSQGDFNVDVVLTLGVREQKDLDQAITAHGRILHDAVVMSVNLVTGSEVGTVNWVDPAASSLSELAAEIANNLGKDLMDGQIATALLTGIVAETERFSNEKTSPHTMKLSAELMTAGANQQLVATELQATPAANNPPDDTSGPDLSAAPLTPPKPKSDDGTLEIAHTPAADAEPTPETTGKTTTTSEPAAEPDTSEPSSDSKQSVLDANPGTKSSTSASDNDTTLSPPSSSTGQRRILEPPTLGGQLTANSEPEGLEGSIDPLGVPQADTNTPLLQRDQPEDTIMPLDLPAPVLPASESTVPLPDLDQTVSAPDDYQPLPTEPPETVSSQPPSQPVINNDSAASASPSNDQIRIDADGNLQLPPTPLSSTPPAQDSVPPTSLTPIPSSAAPQDDSDQTLSDLEQSVQSTHLDAPNVDAARDAVMDAINNVPVTTNSLPPKQDVGASGYLNVQDLPDADSAPPPTTLPQSSDGPDSVPATPPLPPPAPNMTNEPAPNMSPADTPLTMPLPPTFSMPSANPTPPTSSSTSDPAAPPPVPPPMTELPPFSPPK